MRKAGRLFERGVRLSRSGRLAEAEAVLRQALARYEDRAPGHAPEMGAARALWHLCLVRTVLGRTHEAVAAGEAATERWERLLEGPGAHDDELVRDLARCHTDVAKPAMALGRTTEAAAHAVRAVELAERLQRGGHPGAREELATARHQLAFIHHEAGDLDAAAAAIGPVVEERERLAEEAGQRSHAGREYARALFLSARIHRARGDDDRCAAALVRADWLTISLGMASLTAQVRAEMRDLERTRPGLIRRHDG